ncbi:MAG TPA: hypothetical protein VFN64_03870, partial [Burkholderiaceae bacterium]|nr:hypothetical protein [Burkholderiaceae bacterium]
MPTDSTLLSIGVDSSSIPPAVGELDKLDKKAVAVGESIEEFAAKLPNAGERLALLSKQAGEVDAAISKLQSGLRSGVDLGDAAKLSDLQGQSQLLHAMTEATQRQIDANEAWIDAQSRAVATIGMSRSEIMALDAQLRGLTDAQMAQIQPI